MHPRQLTLPWQDNWSLVYLADLRKNALLEGLNFTHSLNNKVSLTELLQGSIILLWNAHWKKVQSRSLLARTATS